MRSYEGPPAFVEKELWLGWVLFSFTFFAAVTTLCVRATYARDDGHWAERVGPLVAEWMGSLMQPVTVKSGSPYSCCGEADAYWGDDVHVATGHDGEKFIIARITDTRDDATLGDRSNGSAAIRPGTLSSS